MRETKEHPAAFNEYYLMGNDRSLVSVASRCGVCVKTAERWSKELNWQDRIALKDIEISRKLNDGLDDVVVNTKADYRKMIKERLGSIKTETSYLTNAYGTAKTKLEDENNTELDVTSIRELTDLAKAMQGMYREEQALMKLDLLMMGEADSRADNTIRINVHGVNMDEFPEPYVVMKDQEDDTE